MQWASNNNCMGDPSDCMVGHGYSWSSPPTAAAGIAQAANRSSKETSRLTTAHLFAPYHIQEESLAVVQLLIDAGAHINCQGQNPLSTAYRHLNSLAASALLGEQNMAGWVPCMAMFEWKPEPSLVEGLLG